MRPNRMWRIVWACCAAIIVLGTGVGACMNPVEQQVTR